MKKLVAMLVMVVMLVSSAVAEGKADIIGYIVELIEGYADQLTFLEECKYDSDADVLMLKMTLDRPMSTYEGLTDADKAEFIKLYMKGDAVMTGSLEIAEVETTTVSIAKTSDNVPFFLCVNGVDQSWLLEE